MSLKETLLTEDNIDSFKATFSTKQGKHTLGIILVLGGFFNDEIKTEQEMGKRNLCTTILKFMGVEEKERSGEFIEAMTDAIVGLTSKEKGEQT